MRPMAVTINTQQVRALPTFTQAAEMIEIDPTGIGRAVAKLGISSREWGGREKRLEIVDVLRIAAKARRASVDEVAQMLLDATESEHPEALAYVEAETERYYDEIRGDAQEENQFLDEIQTALPAKHAKTVEKIYKRYLDNS